MQNFTYNDGGRKASGRKGSAGDCGVRAMAIALGLDYDTCYKELAQANKDAGYEKSARNGLFKEVFQSVLEKHGWTWHTAPTFSGRKAYVSDLPQGTHICRMRRHYATVIDGVLHDTFDSSYKMVYGYWSKNNNSFELLSHEEQCAIIEDAVFGETV